MTTGFRALASLLHNYVRCQQAWGEPKLLEYPARLFASAGAWILPSAHILGQTSAFPKKKEWASATKSVTEAWDLKSQAAQTLREREKVSKMFSLGALPAPVLLLSLGLLLLLHQCKLEQGQLISWCKVYRFFIFFQFNVVTSHYYLLPLCSVHMDQVYFILYFLGIVA